MTKVEIPDGQLHYAKYGSGDRVLIAFHGFGQDKQIFEPWQEIIGRNYTIYAFDLFHHGDSRRIDRNLSKDEWAGYFQSFLAQENISHFSILGFSLGGRFAITTSLSMPDKVEELILIAPDGVFLTMWFKLATNPNMRWLFKYLMLNPNKLDRLISYNERVKIVSPYIGDFVKKELGDAHNRKRVYKSWNQFKPLGFKRKELIRQFASQSFNRRIILGNKDHIIKPNQILPIIEKMGGFEISILPMKHHQLIKPEVARQLLRRE